MKQVHQTKRAELGFNPISRHPDRPIDTCNTDYVANIPGTTPDCPCCTRWMKVVDDLQDEINQLHTHNRE